MGCETGQAWRLQSFGGQDLFPTAVEKIARLGYGLAANHAFIDGNKRIGAMIVQLLLKWNGYQLKLQSGELADMFIVSQAAMQMKRRFGIGFKHICNHILRSKRAGYRPLFTYSAIISFTIRSAPFTSPTRTSILKMVSAR